jgi:hypothetical protein
LSITANNSLWPHERSTMSETQEAPDYVASALQNMIELELKRGLVAAELDV